MNENLAGHKAAPPVREEMMEGELTIADVKRLDTADRVILVSRSLPLNLHLHQEPISRFPKVELREFGFGVDVREFSR